MQSKLEAKASRVPPSISIAPWPSCKANEKDYLLAASQAFHQENTFSPELYMPPITTPQQHTTRAAAAAKIRTSPSASMASGGLRSMASGFLFLNLVMYVVVAVIAGWALNYSIDDSAHSLKGASPPVRLFPIYFPMGNMATGFFVIFALLASAVGIATSLTGLLDVTQGYPASMMSATASAVVTWILTVLAMGLACKEISIGWRPPSLRALETFTIILAGTQLLCVVSLHAGANAAITATPMGVRPRV